MRLVALFLILFSGPVSAMELGGPRKPENGVACGGIAGLSCSDGSYCEYPVEARCGAADQQGVCRPRPQMCTQQYQPVCGCDDRTYGNACEAAAAGVSVVRQGECDGGTVMQQGRP